MSSRGPGCARSIAIVHECRPQGENHLASVSVTREELVVLVDATGQPIGQSPKTESTRDADAAASRLFGPCLRRPRPCPALPPGVGQAYLAGSVDQPPRLIVTARAVGFSGQHWKADPAHDVLLGLAGGGRPACLHAGDLAAAGQKLNLDPIHGQAAPTPTQTTVDAGVENRDLAMGCR